MTKQDVGFKNDVRNYTCKYVTQAPYTERTTQAKPWNQQGVLTRVPFE
jgi:hypothetical protein